MGKFDRVLHSNGLDNGRWEALRPSPLKYKIKSISGDAAYYVKLFPSIDAVTAIETVGFPESSLCYLCGDHATAQSTAWPNSLASILKAAIFGPKSVRVPVCDAHNTARAKCVIEPTCWRSKFAMLSCVTLSKEFCNEFERCMNHGEYYPPWIVFPTRGPESSWNQGVNEIWIERWAKFWYELNARQQSQYADKWKFRKDWQNAIESGYCRRFLRVGEVDESSNKAT